MRPETQSRLAYLAFSVIVLVIIALLLTGCGKSTFSYTGNPIPDSLTAPPAKAAEGEPVPVPAERQHEFLGAAAKANADDARAGLKAVSKAKAAMPEIAATPGVPAEAVGSVNVGLDTADQRFNAIGSRSEQMFVVIPVAKAEASAAAEAANEARAEVAELKSNAYGQQYARWLAGIMLVGAVGCGIAATWFRSERLAGAAFVCIVVAAAAYAYAQWIALIVQIVLTAGVIAGLCWLAWALHRRYLRQRERAELAEQTAVAAVKFREDEKALGSDPAKRLAQRDQPAQVQEKIAEIKQPLRSARQTPPTT